MISKLRNKMEKRPLLPEYLNYFITNYIFGIIIFFLLRVLLLLGNLQKLESIKSGETAILLFKSFIFGFRFDTVILCYLLAIPTLLLIVFSYLGKLKFNYYKIINLFLSLMFFVVFLISLIDIPYYNQFLERLTIEALEWMDTPLIILKMIFTDKTNFVFIFILLILLAILVFYYKQVLKKFSSVNICKMSYLKLSIVNLLLIAFIFLGIRGRIAIKSPIRVGTAFFSDYSFINKLGLNPSFTLIKSALSKNKKRDIHLIDEEFAIGYLKQNLNSTDENFPLAREVKYDGEEHKYNVVLVIIESMTAENLAKYGGKPKLTPFLNSIMDKSLVFNNFYSAGIHTYNGIYSCLTSFPTVLKKHSMKGVIIPKYNGISNVLKSKGYSTMFFINHDSEFDNVGGFVKNNDFDEVISQKDYPSNKVVSSLGVGDDFLFEFSIDKINQRQKPFFSCFMTASNHGPYKIPEYANFIPKSKEIKSQLIEYTDWSLEKFITLAQKEPWFENTIFVFTGDHGKGDNTPYGISFAYHRVPLVVYAPKIIKPKEVNSLCGQIDILPIVMNLLNSSYTNNTYGKDILSEERKYIYFTNNENIACLNEDFLYIFGKNIQEGLYKYKELDTKNYILEKPKLATDMKDYVFSMLQSSQWMIKNKKTYYRINE